MKRIKIKLKKKDTVSLKQFTKKGKRSARSFIRAQVLLLAHKGERDTNIAKILGITRASVYNIKKRYVEEGLESALEDKPRSGQPKKYTEKHKAEIIALACTTPPKGRKRWTISLLLDALEKREDFKTLNPETIRLILKKAGLNLGKGRCGASRK